MLQSNSNRLRQTSIKWLCVMLISCFPTLSGVARQRAAELRPEFPARSLAQQYQRLADARRPLYLTSDVAFERTCLLYAEALTTLENESLAPQLGVMLTGLQRAVREKIAAGASTEAPTAPVIAALRDNEAYVETALRLLGRRETPFNDAREEQVQAELRLINQAGGLRKSPLMGYLEDYSQYTPRGHYAESEPLRRYFRAITWLGRMGFYTAAHPAAGVTEAQARDLTTRALTLFTVLAQTDAAHRALSNFENTLGTLYGPSDDLAADEALRELERATGQNLTYAKLADADQLAEPARVIINAQARRARINSSVAHEGEVLPPVLKLLGQRFTFDSQIYQSLTFSNVQDYQGTGQPFTLSVTANGRRVRGVPRGLDVLAALGQDAAARAISADGDAMYAGYDVQMQQLRAQAQTYLNDSQSFYTAYLRAVQATGSTDGAEARRRVNTALGGYILLRHSSVAYAKQSYTMIGKGLGSWPDEADTPQLYVAPEADAFTALAQALERLAPVLEQSRNSQTLLFQSRQLSSWLQLAATHAGRGPVPAKAAQQLWRTMQDWSRSDKETARVTDVHTDLNSSEVLQLGVGAPQTLARTVSGTRAYAAVFSCYELRQPMRQRLTDEAWRMMLTRSPESLKIFYATSTPALSGPK